MMRSQKEGCAVNVSKAISLGLGRPSDQSDPTQFSVPQSSFVIRCLRRVMRIAQHSSSLFSFPLGLQNGFLVGISPGSRACAQRSNSGLISPQSVIPIVFPRLILKLVQHSFSSVFGSPSNCLEGSQFGGSCLQSLSPSGLTPRSSGPDCVGPLNFFR